MDAARDFELLSECLESNAPPLWKEGQFYDSTSEHGSRVPKCTADCSFRKLKGTRFQSLLFVCRDHGRVHICGPTCPYQVDIAVLVQYTTTL